jgi:hypothetical protein
MDGDVYPLYHIRNNIGHGYKTHGQLVDNWDVVPYNPFLSQKYSCHFNINFFVSICANQIHSQIY